MSCVCYVNSFHLAEFVIKKIAHFRIAITIMSRRVYDNTLWDICPKCGAYCPEMSAASHCNPVQSNAKLLDELIEKIKQGEFDGEKAPEKKRQDSIPL